MRKSFLWQAAVVAVGVCVHGLAEADEVLPRITAPLNGQVFEPGSVVQLRVDPGSSPTDNDAAVIAQLDMENSVLTRLPPPNYEAAWTLPTSFSGQLQLKAVVKTGLGLVETTPLSIIVRASESPESLSIHVPDSIYLGSEPTDIPAEISVRGKYFDGKDLPLTEAVTGTSYTSSEPSVVSVDPNGVLSPLDTGVSIITVSNGGVSATAGISVRSVALGLEDVVEVTASAGVTKSGFRQVLGTDRYSQQVTVKCIGQKPFAYPLSIVVSNLTPGVTLVSTFNYTRTITPIGSGIVRMIPGITNAPYFLMPGEVATGTLTFRNPFGVPLSYDARVFSGSKL